MVGGSFFLLPAFFKHSSLSVLAWMGMSRQSCSKGIFTHIFFNSVSMLYLGGTTSFSKANLSGYGGALLTFNCSFWVSFVKTKVLSSFGALSSILGLGFSYDYSSIVIGEMF